MTTLEKCRTCKHAFTTSKDRWYCKKSLADKDDCGEYEMTAIEKSKAEIKQIADEEQKHDEKWAIGLRYAVKIIDKYAEQEPTTRQSCENCKQDPKECGNDAHYGFCQNWEYAEQEPTDEWQNGYDRAWAEAEVFYEQEPCEDAVSRQAVDEIKELMTDINGDTVYAVRMSEIRQLPSVRPQEQTGHWKAKSFHELYCDNCRFDFDIMRNDFVDKMKYCPNCGCPMVDPQESEVRNEKETR